MHCNRSCCLLFVRCFFAQVLLATESLTLVDGNVATEFIAGVGHEIVQFEPSGVELVGRVEEYLTKVLHGIMLTLQVSARGRGARVFSCE